MKAIVGTMICVGALSIASTATAADGNVPAACGDSAQMQRAYFSGVQTGKSLVQRAWLSVNDCGKLEYFSAIVRENVEMYVLQGVSSYAICRYAGMLDGVYDELDQVWISCGGPCCFEGRVVGALSAAVYCHLSEVLGGLSVPDDFVPRPVCTCDGFSRCCAGTFTDLTREKCPAYAAHPYYEVWQRSRALQCNE
jgi:hypothetical protein